MGNDDSELTPAEDTPANVSAEDTVRQEQDENVFSQVMHYQSTEKKHLCVLMNKNTSAETTTIKY